MSGRFSAVHLSFYAHMAVLCSTLPFCACVYPSLLSSCLHRSCHRDMPGQWCDTSASCCCWYGATCNHFMLQGHDVLSSPNVGFQVTVLHPISACNKYDYRAGLLMTPEDSPRLKCHKDGMTHGAIRGPVFKIKTVRRFHHFRERN